MANYLSFIHAGIEASQAEQPRSALEDGILLAGGCIQKLEKLDPERFRPRLLILLASSNYIELKRAQFLLEGIHREFSLRRYTDMQLIGSSVAAVFFDGKIHPKGALLICLASRLLDVKVAYSLSMGGTPENSAKELLQKLGIDRESGNDPNLFANRALLTFLPGNSEQGYLAVKLHNSLRERVWARVPIVGGVSSGFDGRRFRQGLQFVDRQVLKNATVAALLTTRTLLGMSVNDSLERIEAKVRITGLEQDGRTVTEFDKRPSREVLNELEREHGFVVFGKRTYNGEPVVERPWAVDDPPRVKLLREAKVGDDFRVLKVNSDLLSKGTGNSIDDSCKSVGLSNPTGCIGFRCSGYFASAPAVGIDLTQEIASVEGKLGIPAGGYVGGFFDGEAGRDKLGSSQLRSWSTAAIVFGDELRHRTAVNAGFDQIAGFLSRYLSDTESSESFVLALPKLVYDVGFPGARLLLVMEGNEGRRLVVPDEHYTFGSMKPSPPGSFPYYVRLGTNEPSDEPAAQVERAGEPRFFSYDESDRQATSYYFSPLKTILHNIVAVFQIDVGRKKQLRGDERTFLKRLCAIVGANLTHIFNWQEAMIRHRLQDALRGSLSSSSTVEGVRKYLEGALKAIDLKMGHIRLADPKLYKLVLYAGTGEYYEAAYNVRCRIDYGDNSPTTRAFKKRDTVIIINDARNDPEHQSMIARWADATDEPEIRLKKALESVGSYANVSFSSERDFRGTINLVSEQPLFFKYAQKRVLHNIAEQVGFLIDYLEQKAAETKALKEAEEASKAEQQTNKRLEFIQAVSSHLGQQDLEDFRGTLDDVLTRFREAVGATVASLYIWDEARSLYVLRAEYGWDHPNFVDVANYAKDAGWFGVRALQGEPRYIPDLADYYKTKGYRRTEKDDSMPGGRFSKYMFGRGLTNFQPVEVIGIPLCDAHEEDIGVLAFYRPTEEKQPSGFSKTVVDMIQNPAHRNLVAGAAYDVAGLISALLQRLSDRTESDEQGRRKRISDALSKHIEDHSTKSFEDLLCRSVGEAYGTVRADLYSIRLRKGAPAADVEWLVRYSHRGETVGVGQPLADKLLDATAAVYASKLDSSEVAESDVRVKRRTLAPEERNDPLVAATEGLVERICLPLVLSRRHLWVLDLRWEVNSPKPHGAQDHLSSKYLWLLGSDLSKFSRLHIQTRETDRAREEASRHLKSQRGLLGKLGVMANYAHDWKNQMPIVKEGAKRIKEIEDAAVRERAVDALLAQLEAFGSGAREMLTLADENQQPRPVYLCKLIETQVETLIASRKRDREIVWRVDIPKEMRVLIRPSLMKLAFRLIIANAVKYTEETPDAFLSISAVPDEENKKVNVCFANNGGQITARFRDAINEGRYEDLKTHGGLAIALSFAKHDDGDLIVQTPTGGDTVIVFTLPIASEEEEARWT